MRKKIKRTTRQYIIVAILSAIIIGGAFTVVYFTVFSKAKEKYLVEIQVLEEQLKSHEVYVYEAKSKIEAGSIVKTDMLNYVQSYSNQAQKYFMTKEDIGKVALIRIDPDTQILKGMLTNNLVDGNAREAEFNTFLINSNIKENDFVDVRIVFPNGEDYVVLSKKSMKQVNLESNNCFLWLTEDEILNMSSAIVDAYLYTGSKLYTTKYIEPNLQDASRITYHPSTSTLTLMEQDANIVNKAKNELSKRLRKELENRLALHLNKDVSEITSPTQEQNLIGEQNLSEDISLNQDTYLYKNNEKVNNQNESSNSVNNNISSEINNQNKDDKSMDENYFIEQNGNSNQKGEEVIVEYGG